MSICNIIFGLAKYQVLYSQFQKNNKYNLRSEHHLHVWASPLSRQRCRRGDTFIFVLWLPGLSCFVRTNWRRSDRGPKLPTGQLASKYSNPCFCPQPWPADNRIIRPRTTLHSPRPARPSIICKNLNKYRLRLNHVSSSFVWFNGTFRAEDRTH